MTFLVVGAGSIGRRHAENLQALGAAVEPLGWRETSVDAIAERLAKGRVTGMVIATATQIRLPLITAAANANVPIYVEKPLAYAPDTLAEIMATAKPIAARSMLGYMMRYHPAFRALADADLTDTFRFDFIIGHDVTQWRQNWRFSQSYAAMAEGGGVLLDLCHELDMAACLFPGLKLGTVDSLGHPAYPGVDMASRIALIAPNGATGTVAMDYLAPRLIRRAMICTPQTTHDFDFAAQDYRTETVAGVTSGSHPLERNAMFLDAMRDFIALATGKPPSANPHLPRLDRVAESCALIASAWTARRFAGTIERDIP